MIGVKVKLLLPLGGKSWKVSPLLQGQEKKGRRVLSAAAQWNYLVDFPLGDGYIFGRGNLT